MILPLKVLLFLCGMYFLTEGALNLWYWKNRPTRPIFQIGRFLRALAGFIIILISVLGA